MASHPDVPCRFMPGGGGVYIANGDLQQDDGSIQLRFSRSQGSGGGLLIQNGRLKQHGGNISCQNCEAKQHGGCFAVEGGTGRFGMNSSGSITARGCVAKSGPEWPSAVAYYSRCCTFTKQGFD